MGFILENFSYKVTLTGGSELLIEGHKGIVEYAENRLVVRIKGGKIAVNGDELFVKEINEQELLLSGSVTLIEVIR